MNALILIGAVGLLVQTPEAKATGARLELRELLEDHALGSVPLPRKAPGVKKWAPIIGAAAGASVVFFQVRDERDFVFTGKLMWIGIGAGAGAAAGWLIGWLANR